MGYPEWPPRRQLLRIADDVVDSLAGHGTRRPRCLHSFPWFAAYGSPEWYRSRWLGYIISWLGFCYGQGRRIGTNFEGALPCPHSTIERIIFLSRKLIKEFVVYPFINTGTTASLYGQNEAEAIYLFARFYRGQSVGTSRQSHDRHQTRASWTNSQRHSGFPSVSSPQPPPRPNFFLMSLFFFIRH